MGNIHDRIQLIIDTYGDGKNTSIGALIGENEANIRGYCKNRMPKPPFLEKIVKYFDISAEWLITGEGSMLKSDGIPTSDSLPVAKPADPALGIPLIPSEAFCGYGTPAFDDQAIEEFYYVAEFKQADFLIRVKGNSMYPKYSSGDIIACRKVNELLYFQWNKIYAIYTNSQGIMVKRVRESSKGDDYVTLISDNPNYAPFDIPRSDIAAIALVIGVIRVE